MELRIDHHGGRLDILRRPVAQRVSAAAVEALSQWKLSTTVRAYSLACESVEGLTTLPTLPIVSERRRSLARWASIPLAPRNLCQSQERLRMFEGAPAVHKHKECKGCQPHVLGDECQNDEAGDPDQTENSRHQQTARSSKHIPE